VLKVVVRRNTQKKVGQIRCASGRRSLQIALFCWELGAQLRVSFNAVLLPNCGWSTGWCSAGRWLRGVRRARVLLLLSPFGRRKHSRFYTRLWRSPATLMLYASCIIIAESSEEPQPWILCVEPRRLFRQCCAGVARRRKWQIVSHASRKDIFKLISLEWKRTQFNLKEELKGQGNKMFYLLSENFEMLSIICILTTQEALSKMMTEIFVRWWIYMLLNFIKIWITKISSYPSSCCFWGREYFFVISIYITKLN
jgi:hypothetical protein